MQNVPTFYCSLNKVKNSVSDENELVFGNELSLDIMSLDASAVSRIMDRATKF